MHTAEQTVNLLRQVEVGVATARRCRRHGKKLRVVEQTYYRWHRECGVPKVDQARRLKELEFENTKLKASSGEPES